MMMTTTMLLALFSVATPSPAPTVTAAPQPAPSAVAVAEATPANTIDNLREIVRSLAATDTETDLVSALRRSLRR
jgi:hypothetical protein